MVLARWRARRALVTRSPPSYVEDAPPARLVAVVADLRERLGATDSLGDPVWHCRWDGALQLVGLDATERSVADVRQRLMRLVHEVDLRHMTRSRRRILAVVLVAPREGEGPTGWSARLGDVSEDAGGSDWKAVRRRPAVLAIDPQGGHSLFGGDAAIRRAVQEWAAAG